MCMRYQYTCTHAEKLEKTKQAMHSNTNCIRKCKARSPLSYSHRQQTIVQTSIQMRMNIYIYIYIYIQQKGNGASTQTTTMKIAQQVTANQKAVRRQLFGFLFAYEKRRKKERESRMASEASGFPRAACSRNFLTPFKLNTLIDAYFIYVH